jgi:phage-related minor tail protein
MKASGGPVQAGMPYLVGERGPEIIVPRASATVIPNGRIGAQNNYISLTVETPTGRIPMETQQQLGNRLARALSDARRRNG